MLETYPRGGKFLLNIMEYRENSLVQLLRYYPELWRALKKLVREVDFLIEKNGGLHGVEVDILLKLLNMRVAHKSSVLTPALDRAIIFLQPLKPRAALDEEAEGQLFLPFVR